MQVQWFTFFTLIARLFAARNELARDYFFYKQVPSVVAFLCEHASRDLEFNKMLSSEGMRVAIFYPGFEFSLEKVMAATYSQFGVFLDLNCGSEYSEFILTESSKLRTFNDSYIWLLFGENLNESVDLLHDETFSIGTDLVIATPRLNEYTLYDVYNPAKERGGKLNVTELASWHNETGFNVTLNQEKYQRRANFHGLQLKVIAVTQYRPDDMSIEEYLQDHTTKALDSMTKFGFAILSHLGDIFNFTMDIEETSFWDQVTENGTHLGMVGILHRSEADISATPALLFKERAILIKAIHPVWPWRTCFMFRSMASRVSDEFIRPFSTKSWIVTAVVVTISVIVLGLTLKVELVKDRFNTWIEVGFVATGIMCQQGSLLVPTSISSRLVVLNLLYFSILIYNYYSASVVSAQLNQPLEKMNDSMHQLAQSNLQIAAEPITYTNFGLTAQKDWEIKEFYVKRWKPLADRTRYIPLEEGFARVAKGGFAYHTDPNTGYPYVERLFTNQMICELTEVHLFRPQMMSLSGRHNSPFTEMAKIGALKLSSAGLLTRQQKRWMARKPMCIRDSFILQSISILTTAPAFIILFVGIFLASMICLWENLIFKSQDSSK
ncbi:ionotropic receptor 75a-like isoform X1 [Neodiprion lecontei]|uniref:Ionotropic receptor 75a-like isoform X1 n=2 Tax=Neodiprion lecontei TaxID=441921 RepID=A0A6J0BVS3_NEOLC|nr:ionotropic receptor 75a-like isoform X1 [Neodiprion lecontei]